MDYFELIQEAHKKATKDSICFLQAVSCGDCEFRETGGVALPDAGTYIGEPFNNLGAAQHVAAQGKFVYGSGGTTAKYYLQSSLDKGISWFDVICFAFAKESKHLIAAASLGNEEANPEVIEDGELSDNTARQGVLGDVFRIKSVIVGTYVDSYLCLSGIVKSF